MWVPESESDIVAAVESLGLEESSIFDAKQELPKENKEIAKDIAAMANDGGVLLYGLGEDENHRPVVLKPFSLANQPERITAIVQSSISEPPRIRINTIRTEDDPSMGYIVVVVPPSDRAPHMVEVRGDNRYYGRTATGNKRLTQVEVARLYERRNRLEIDREMLLDKEIKHWAISPKDGHGYLYLFARPVLSDDGMLDKAVGEGQTRWSVLYGLVELVKESNEFTRDYWPNFDPPNRWIQRTEGLLGKMHGDNPDEPERIFNIQIDFDGTGHLFCGRAAQMERSYQLFHSCVAGNTGRFLRLVGELYARSSYLGVVDVGLELTGIQGSVVMIKHPHVPVRLVPYEREVYRRTLRVGTTSLKADARSIAIMLLKPFFDAISQNSLDPFA